MITERISVTEKAKAVIDQLREKHGELMFHQSGGCCDGSAPMCFEKGEFLIGPEIYASVRFMVVSFIWLKINLNIINIHILL